MATRRLFTRFLGSAVSNAAGYGVGGAILPTLEPYTQDLANQTWNLHPAKPLPAGLAAEAALRGYWPEERGEQEARYTGHDSERFEQYFRLAGQTPPLETLLALRRRDLINDGQLEQGIAQAGYLPEWRARIASMLYVLPSVTDLIRMAVREVFDPGQRAALDLDAEYPDELTERGRAIGLSPATTRNYWAAHWELPSYTQATQMLFRGAISQDLFGRLLRALDYAPTWRGPLEEIARVIPSISDMTRLVVREVYDSAKRSALGLDAEYPPEFSRQVAKHGMREEDARDLWAGHWRPVSALQGYRMLHRGLIDEGDLDDILKQLDYTPRNRPLLAALSHLVPGRIDLKRMLRHEILSPAEVEAGYRRLGYDDTDARRMREIAVAELEASETGSPWASKARSSLFTLTHREYLDGSINEAQATSYLQRVGALAAERPIIIGLWNDEREIRRRELTPAEIRKARNEGVYDETRALAELIERGMTDEDARTYLASG